MNVLTNVLILERFVNNVLNRFIHPDERGGREATSFSIKGWTLLRESWMTFLFFRKGWTLSGEGWTLPREDWTSSLLRGVWSEL